MSEETTAKKKASANKSYWKANRIAKRKGHYAAQFGITDRNKRRRIKRHVRANPNDTKAIKRYEETYGKVSEVGLSSKGRKQKSKVIGHVQVRLTFLEPAT